MIAVLFNAILYAVIGGFLGLAFGAYTADWLGRRVQGPDDWFGPVLYLMITTAIGAGIGVYGARP